MSATILALDTSTSACSVALLHNNKQLQRFANASREHTKLILPMVDEVLSEAGIGLADVSALAFTRGPGSFTGIRIGFGVVQGLAFGAEIPVIPVSTLETLAMTAVRRLDIPNHTIVVPMLDARMDEVYWGCYLTCETGLQQRHEDSLSAPEKILLELDSAQSIYGIGDGWRYGQRLPLTASQVSIDMLPAAQDILSIALAKFERGHTSSVDQVQPVYLRDTVSWKKRQRIRQP